MGSKGTLNPDFLQTFISFSLLLLITSVILPACASANWLNTYGITSKHELNQPSVAPKLAKALKDPNPKIRLASIKYLMRLGAGARAAIPELGDVLATDLNIKLRLFACDALATIGGAYDEQAASYLINALTDPNLHIRKRALLNLQKSRYKGTDLQIALQKMSAEDPNPGLRKIATGILVRTTTWVPKKQTEYAVAGPDREYGSPDFKFPSAKEVNRYAVAVIIGNKNYAASKKGVPDVDFAENDAEVIYHYVTKSLGYREGNVIYIKDATQADFISTFGTAENPKGKLYDWIRPDKSDVFVYYSGHGAPGLTHGKSYLLPVNADPMKVELNGYGLDTLYANIGKLPARNIMVVIDACFSGGSASGSIIQSASSISLRVVESKPTAIPQATILTAAKAQEVASWDEKAGHGLFTRHFLEGMTGMADTNNFGNGDGIITLAELKNYLSEEVSYRARRTFGRDQHPQVMGDDSKVLAILPIQ